MSKHKEAEVSTCEQCGAKVVASPVGTLCAECLMRGGLDEENPSLDESATAVGKPFGDLEGAGAMIGRYKLLQKIGEGGFGVVYMAEQREPVVRKVALKIIKLGMDTRIVIARFEAERQALALMDHPNIARVLDAGATEAGRPYFVMELVRGVPITKFCDEQRLTTESRLKLILEVCSAVQHAHQKGIIHRDLKPTNVLVAMDGDRPLPKIIDFGIAKATQGKLTDKTLFTEFHQFIGTPAYMSPEQAHLSARDIDTRTDIYALGVLLYELLTGSTPFEIQDLQHSALDEILRTIREHEPLRPSTRLKETLSPHSGKIASPSPARYRRAPIAPDLDWIVLKAMEKDRARRYETANALAEDIKRYLKDEPVVAAAPNLTYTFGKFARRNKLVLGSAVAVLLTLAIGLSVAVIAFVREHQAREQAEMLQYASDMKVAISSMKSGDVEGAFALLDRHIPDDGSLDWRGWEWRYVDQFRRQDIATLLHLGSISEIDFMPDGRHLIVGYAQGPGHLQIRIIDMEKMLERDSFALPEHAWVGGFGFLPERRSVVIEGNYPMGLRLVELDTRATRNLLPPRIREPCWPPRISTDGRWMVAGYPAEETPNRGRGLPAARVVKCIDLDKEQVVASVPFTAPDMRMLDHELFISPDVKRVAVACADATVKLFSMPDLQLLNEIKVAGSPTCLRWSDNSRSLAVACEFPNVVQVWEVLPNTAPRQLLREMQKSPSYDIRLSPDATLVASGTYDNLVILWDLQSDPPVKRAVFHGHRRLLTSLVFSPDGTRLYSADQGGDLKVWNTSVPKETRLREIPDEQVGRAVYSPDGNLLAVVARDGVVRLFQSESAQIIDVFQPERGLEMALADFGKDNYPPVRFSEDGRFLAAGNGDHAATIYDVVSRSRLRQLQGHQGYIHGLAFSPRAKTVYSVSEDGTVKAWDLATGAIVASEANPMEGEALYAIDCSADGRWLAAAGKMGGLTLHDADTLAVVSSIRISEDVSYRPDPIHSLRFSPDGKTLVCGQQNEMLLLEVPSLRLVAPPFTGLSGAVSSVDFTPDGSTLIGVSEFGLSQMVNLRVMETVGDIANSTHRLISANFSPDGQTLAISGLGTGLRIFHAPLNSRD